MEPYKRKCANWVQAFMNWTEPRSIAPISVLTMCALYTLSSVLRRNVRIPKVYKETNELLLGGWSCYPNIYTCFVAPPGTITKSTSVGFVEELLNELPFIHRTPDTFTTPILIKRLADDNNLDQNLAIIIGELGTVIEKAGNEIFTTLINLFDAKGKVDEETIGRGEKIVKDPAVTLLAATTPEWLTANLTVDILNGGYGSRTIHILEDAPRNPRLFYTDVEHKLDYEKLKLDLLEDLVHISNIDGDFYVSKDARLFLEDLYQRDLVDKNPIYRRISGYRQRRSTILLKFAMLLKIAISDELLINLEIAQAADTLLQFFETKMVNVFKDLGKNKYTADLISMLEYIKMYGQVKVDDFNTEFLAVADSRMLEILVKSLLGTRKIKKVMIEGKEHYVYNDAKKPVDVVQEAINQAS